MKQACKNNKVCTISLPLHTVTLISTYIEKSFYVPLKVLHCVLLGQIDDLSVNLLDANFQVSTYDIYYKVFIISHLLNY